MFRSHLVHVQQSGYRANVPVPFIPLPVVMQEHGAEVRPEVHRAATENMGKNWQWKEA